MHPSPGGTAVRSQRLACAAGLAAAVLLAAVAGAAEVGDGPPTSAGVHATVERWDAWETALQASRAYANPFTEVDVTATFTHVSAGKAVTVCGFHDGGVAGTFKDLYGYGGDFSRYNVEKFRAIDAFVDALRRADIVASPYFYYFNDKVQRKMTPEQDRAYLRYGMARFGAYANVMPVLSNEVEQKATERRGQYDLAAHAWANKMGPYLASQAVFGLPVTVHNPMETEKAVRPGFYTLLADWPFPWACCMLRQAQVGALGAVPALSDDVPEQKNPVYDARAYARHNALLIDLRRYKAPVINEEPGYEMGPPRKAGDKVLPWNSQTSETLLPTFWTAATAGAYAVWGSAGTYETGGKGGCTHFRLYGNGGCPLFRHGKGDSPLFAKARKGYSPLCCTTSWPRCRTGRWRPPTTPPEAAETTVEGAAYRTNFCLAKAGEAYLVFSLAGGKGGCTHFRLYGNGGCPLFRPPRSPHTIRRRNRPAVGGRWSRRTRRPRRTRNAPSARPPAWTGTNFAPPGTTARVSAAPTACSSYATDGWRRSGTTPPRRAA